MISKANVLMRPLLFLVLMGVFCLPLQYSFGDPGPSGLKKYMFQFQILLADLQMLKGGDPPTDWKKVDSKLKELKRSLAAMRENDPSGTYSPYLIALSSQVTGLERFSRKKDPELFDKIDPITKSCFECHAAHGALGITDTKH